MDVTRFLVMSRRALSVRKLANESYVRYKNRCIDLQSHLQVPLFDPNEAPFRPSLEEMKCAESLFVSKGRHIVRFLKSTIHHYPEHDIPEVRGFDSHFFTPEFLRNIFLTLSVCSQIALFGRSNVGKSSLLQAVFSQVPGLLVKVSKKPVRVWKKFRDNLYIAKE